MLNIVLKAQFLNRGVYVPLGCFFGILSVLRPLFPEPVEISLEVFPSSVLGSDLWLRIQTVMRLD